MKSTPIRQNLAWARLEDAFSKVAKDLDSVCRKLLKNGIKDDD